MPKYSPAISIVCQDVPTGGGPDFVSSIISAGFDLAEVGYLHDDDRAQRELGITWGLMPPTGLEGQLMLARLAWDGGEGSEEARDTMRPEFAELLIAVADGKVTLDDIAFGARVLNRYLRLVEANGWELP